MWPFIPVHFFFLLRWVKDDPGMGARIRNGHGIGVSTDAPSNSFKHITPLYIICIGFQKLKKDAAIHLESFVEILMRLSVEGNREDFFPFLDKSQNRQDWGGGGYVITRPSLLTCYY